MKTYYVKRIQSHVCDIWGVQVSCVKTILLRVHVTGSYGTKNLVKARWEWVCTGVPIEGKELESFFRMFPICEFQNDDDLMHRALKRCASIKPRT